MLKKLIPYHLKYFFTGTFLFLTDGPWQLGTE